MPSLEKDSTILIIGGGTWGCSTAMQLSRRGYTNVTVLEAHPIPSPISAGNDLNKIMEEGEPSEDDSDETYVWNRMHQITTKYWKEDTTFQRHYHETGIIFSACSPEVYEHVKGYTTGHESEFEALESAADFHKTMPEGVLTGQFPGWRGFWRKDGAGWVFARGAMLSAYREAKANGVKFVCGEPQGKVDALLYSEDKKTVLGARTVDGVEHKADRTILSAGAGADLLFDFKNQLRPTAWTLAHIPLTPEEYRLFTNLPVLFNAERGFFIQPDAENHELKLCDEHPGYINIVRDGTHHGEEHSRPFAKQQIPLESEQRMRRFLRDTMPQLADRDFSFARICWDADTMDRQFLIDKHPEHENLIIAAGGSGMGFMMMPCVGQLIADTLESKMEPRLQRASGGDRSRPWVAIGKPVSQDRYGAEGKVMDFHHIKGWTRGRGDKEPNVEAITGALEEARL
ncbi:hypothetical protein H2203_001850 [Taxawa tesnikishii (nom. ined.)]|nr:hypothetical protein H2203_001850 [Dothideales sp. JES 119]